MKPLRLIFIATASVALAACCTVDHPCVRGVPPEDVVQIAAAARHVTSARITKYEHRREDPPREYRLWTADGYYYKAELVHGRWKISEMIIVT